MGSGRSPAEANDDWLCSFVLVEFCTDVPILVRGTVLAVLVSEFASTTAVGTGKGTERHEGGSLPSPANDWAVTVGEVNVVDGGVCIVCIGIVSLFG